MKNILYIENNEAIPAPVKDILKEAYNVTAVSEAPVNGVYDLILIDIAPETDAAELLQKIKANGMTAQTPVILLASAADTDDESKCYEAGAADYIVLPTAVNALLARIGRAIELKELRCAAEEKDESIGKLSSSIVKALAHTIDAKDRYTSGHSQRVASYSREIAKRMGKSPKEQEIIYYMGLLHDVGKIRVPEEIINKPGKLTDEEFDLIRLHPITGYHILKEIAVGEMFSDGARFHHERYDGTGYPNGLAGKQIPEIARIIGVADAYDAMTSNRSYRQVIIQEFVRDEIENGKGTQFDPEIADIMLEIIDEDKDYLLRETDVSRKKILVVDDEPINIKMVTFALRDIRNYTVNSAGSGAEAVEALKNDKFDLVLLDVNMPEMDGFETAGKIRAFSDIPIVFLTADKLSLQTEKMREYGITDFITRPFKPAVLMEILHAVLTE